MITADYTVEPNAADTALVIDLQEGTCLDCADAVEKQNRDRVLVAGDRVGCGGCGPGTILEVPSGAVAAYAQDLAKHLVAPEAMGEDVLVKHVSDYMVAHHGLTLLGVIAPWPMEKTQAWLKGNGFDTKAEDNVITDGGLNVVTVAASGSVAHAIRYTQGPLAGVSFVVGIAKSTDADTAGEPGSQEPPDPVSAPETVETLKAAIIAKAKSRGVEVGHGTAESMLDSFLAAIERAPSPPAVTLVLKGLDLEGDVGGEHEHAVSAQITAAAVEKRVAYATTGIARGHVHTIAIDLEKGTAVVSDEVDPVSGVRHTHPTQFQEQKP